MSDNITDAEIKTLEAYMQTTFANNHIAIRSRDKGKDSAEVLLNGEFIGILSKIVEEGETSYDFSMAILDIDLPQTAA